MKTLYVANKYSYGIGFFEVCDSYDELKKAIVKAEFGEYDHVTDSIVGPEYSEELYQKALIEGNYKPFKVELHPGEGIEFDEYDGRSTFNIVKTGKITSKAFEID